MASLQGFITLLEGEYPDPKIRGKKFEPFLRDALEGSDLRVCVARSEGLEPPTF